MLYKATFDRVVQQFTQDRYASEFAIAREDYFRRTGKVFEDEAMFESRMNSCLEWYLLDRCLWDAGMPPVRLRRLVHSDEISDKERKLLQCLETSIHSLFLVKSVEKEKISVTNLLTSEDFTVIGRDHFPGVHKGDILDARLLHFANENYFTDSLWVHPADAVDFITEETKKRQASSQNVTADARDRLLFDLSYMKLKRDRYAHVSTSQIYDWDAFKRDRQEAA